MEGWGGGCGCGYGMVLYVDGCVLVLVGMGSSVMFCGIDVMGSGFVE